MKTMKSLEEVIYQLENCAYAPLTDDACHYLKMYRSDMQMYAENQKHWEDDLMQKIKDFGDAKERYIKRLKELDIGTLNDPLTWNELRQMEGKPVWIEIGNGWKGWVIIRKVSDSGIVSGSDGFIGLETVYGMDTTWQAYRKERK